MLQVQLWLCGAKEISSYQKDPNYFESIANIPASNQTLPDVLHVKFIFDDLIKEDKNQKRS